MPESNDNQFKWKHFSREIILWAVRWYCQFALAYRDLVIIIEERGIPISHSGNHEMGSEICCRD